MKFFFLLTFAAAIPAIVSGGIAERARFHPQLAATFMLVGFVYPFFEGIAWNGHYGIQEWLTASFGAPFHDFAGSVVVHAVGGWIGLAAVLVDIARSGTQAPEVTDKEEDKNCESQNPEDSPGAQGVLGTGDT